MQKYQNLSIDDTSVEEIPLQEYPRPQLKRDSYICLNGEWDFALSEKEKVNTYDKKITVPFPLEAPINNIKHQKKNGEYLFYKRLINFPSSFIKEKIFLHFDGVDQIAWIYFNGKQIGYHEGGYSSFTIEIPLLLINEINVLEVKVKDDLDLAYPYGKQSLKRGGMWYTPVSGIWKSVWMESVSSSYIEELVITPMKDVIFIRVKGNVQKKMITIYTPEGEVHQSFFHEEFLYKFSHPRFWSPEDPYLYEFKIVTTSDEIKSYFALRDLKIKKEEDGKNYLCLNGFKYFFNGLLDQGYFPEGILTPKSYSHLENDVKNAKEMGFNTLRKHIKVEHELFYYYCDKYGIIVFQDIVNNSPYSFRNDTVKPTLGLTKKDDKTVSVPQKNKDVFQKSMLEEVHQLYNHPCICLWTIFNEGWGQFSSKEMENILLREDETRFIDNTSGWFDQGDSSIISKHIYFKKLKLKSYDKPVIISEFGGFSFKDKNHSFNLSKTYGYKKFKSQDKYQTALIKLYSKEIYPLLSKGLCGAIYTQLSDVEDETNGLLTYDRKTKLSKETIFSFISKIKY